MATKFELSSAAQALLTATPEEKWLYINADSWVHTPNTRTAFQWMEYLVRLPKTQRPDCLQLVADPGMGKTATLNAFLDNHPVKKTDDPLRLGRSVLYAEATADRVGAEAVRYTLLRAAWPEARSFHCTQEEIDRTIAAQGIRVALVDEAGEVFKGGPSAHRRALSEFKRLNNRGLHIVAATVTSLSHVLAVDPQFQTRFKKVVKLPRWKESQELRNFLFGYETNLPFVERSYLDSPAVVRRTLDNGDGITENMLDFVDQAAGHALDRNGTCITDADFEKVESSTAPPEVALRASPTD